MTDKEQLTQLTSHIRKLVELTEQMHETEIYPVSFFSESFDLIYKIQDRLHAMEMGQIELFDQKIREHQAQVSWRRFILRYLPPTNDHLPRLSHPFR